MGSGRDNTVLSIQNAPHSGQIPFIGLRDENDLMIALLMKMPDQMEELTGKILMHEQETHDEIAL